MKTLTRAARIAALKRLLKLLAGKFVEVTITSPAGDRVVIPAALKGLTTDRDVALAFVVPREAHGGTQYDIRLFDFNGAEYDADDQIWRFTNPSGLVAAVEHATPASAAASRLAALQGDPDVVAEARVRLKARCALLGAEVTP